MLSDSDIRATAQHTLSSEQTWPDLMSLKYFILLYLHDVLLLFRIFNCRGRLIMFTDWKLKFLVNITLKSFPLNPGSHTTQSGRRVIELSHVSWFCPLIGLRVTMLSSHWSKHAFLPGSCKNCPINSDDCALKKIRGRRGEKNCGVTKCLKALSLSKRPIEINKRYIIVMTLLTVWRRPTRLTHLSILQLNSNADVGLQLYIRNDPSY